MVGNGRGSGIGVSQGRLKDWTSLGHGEPLKVSERQRAMITDCSRKVSN